jgi:hypothetical protein
VAELQQYCEEQGIPSDSVGRCKFVRFKYNQIEKRVVCANQNKVTYRIDGDPVTVASLEAVAEFVPFTNRNYLALRPRTEEEEVKLEGKLDLHQQLDELSIKATEKWAARPGAETCNTVTVRWYDCGAACIGIVFIVSARGTYSEPDRYAAYFCPTWEDVEALRADFTKIAEEVGFVASK